MEAPTRNEQHALDRCPDRIRAYLETVHHLTLSTGEIVELLHQVRRVVQPAVDQLNGSERPFPSVAVLHEERISLLGSQSLLTIDHAT